MTGEPEWIDELPTKGTDASNRLKKLLHDNPGRWLVTDKAYPTAYQFAKRNGLECAMRDGVTYLRAPETEV